MKQNQGTPKSMMEAIKNGDTYEEIELNIVEFIRNRMSVVGIGSNEKYKAMKELQRLIEFQDKKAA